LSRLSGARIHIAHVSTARAVALVREAKREGLPISCEVTPHHLALTDEWVAGVRTFAWQDRNGRASPYDTSTKVSPPLRGRADVDALWQGLRDGTIDAIATDHAPHASVYKDVEYDHAAFGISGLETALPLLLAAVEAGWLELPTLIERLTLGPARCFGLDAPDLRRDVVLIDPHAEWRVTADALA